MLKLQAESYIKVPYRSATYSCTKSIRPMTFQLSTRHRTDYYVRPLSGRLSVGVCLITARVLVGIRAVVGRCYDLIFKENQTGHPQVTHQDPDDLLISDAKNSILIPM